MPSDFTVIQAVRQRFGDAFTSLEDSLGEPEAPFVGKSKDFPFSCPNVSRGEFAVLQFESLGVSAPLANQPTRPRNILQINGVDIPGSITSGHGKFWKTHSLLVPVNVLKDNNNVLHIESVEIFQEHSIHFDDFIIDNIVVFYKTRQSPVGGGRGTLDPKPRVTATKPKAKPKTASKKKANVKPKPKK
jgi:hypothetical protein